MGNDEIFCITEKFSLQLPVCFRNLNLTASLHVPCAVCRVTIAQNSRWMEYVSMILKGASDIAGYLEAGDPVLVHCSDGWDRTSQLVSLAQLLVDPYYRTIEGFQVMHGCVSL